MDNVALGVRITLYCMHRNLQRHRAVSLRQHGFIVLRWHSTLSQYVTNQVVLVVQWLSVGLAIERSMVRLPAGALSSQLGQLSLPSLRGR